MGDLHPRVGGVWHNAIAAWTPPTFSFDVRGCKEASWEFFLPAGDRHPALARGELAELMDGTVSRWSGMVAEVDWTAGRVTCNGLALEAARYPALDGAGNGSANPTTVATANQARGWLILAVDASVPNADYTTGADGSNDQTALFGANADELGQRWYVGPDRVLRFAADPVTPTLHIRPKLVDLGQADDEYVSTVFVRYQSSSGVYLTEPCTNALAEQRFGFRGLLHDVTGYGVISQARAQDIGNGILAKGRGRLGWTSTVEATAGEVSTSGGVPIDPMMVEGGRQLMRAHGIFDDLNDLRFLDVLVGESTHPPGGVVSLAPLGKVAETMEEIAEEQTLLALGVPPNG